MEADISSQAVGLASNTDFSLLSLFIRADIIVKSVIILLIASSIYSWALIFDKYRMFKKINDSTEKFEDKFWKSKSAEGFSKTLPAKSEDPMTQIFQSAMNEVVRTRSKTSINDLLRDYDRISVKWIHSSTDIYNRDGPDIMFAAYPDI